MNPTLLSLTILALWLPAKASESPEGRDEGGGHRPPPPRPLFEALDSDGDRNLSEDEIAAAADALQELDRDGDGRIDLPEVLPPPPSHTPEHDGTNHRQPPPPLFMVIDGDRDGSISGKELEGASEAIFRLDRNGDGEIDGHESGPPPPHRRQLHNGGEQQPFSEDRDGPPHGHPPHPPRGSGR